MSNPFKNAPQVCSPLPPHEAQLPGLIHGQQKHVPRPDAPAGQLGPEPGPVETGGPEIFRQHDPVGDYIII